MRMLVESGNGCHMCNERRLSILLVIVNIYVVFIIIIMIIIIMIIIIVEWLTV